MPWSQTDISELLIAHRARGAICEDLQKENANLKDKLSNRDLNIRHLTKLLKLAGTVRINIEKTIENTGLCHNPLCENEELPSEMIGQQCNCGGYIWHKDEYTEGDFCLESNSCAHCHVEMEYLHGIIEKRETCRRCDNILEQDPSAFQ